MRLSRQEGSGWAIVVVVFVVVVLFCSGSNARHDCRIPYVSVPTTTPIPCQARRSGCGRGWAGSTCMGRLESASIRKYEAILVAVRWLVHKSIDPNTVGLCPRCTSALLVSTLDQPPAHEHPLFAIANRSTTASARGIAPRTCNDLAHDDSCGGGICVGIIGRRRVRCDAGAGSVGGRRGLGDRERALCRSGLLQLRLLSSAAGALR
jgi:hypothetical protein